MPPMYIPNITTDEGYGRLFSERTMFILRGMRHRLMKCEGFQSVLYIVIPQFPIGLDGLDQ
jgi:hypothetical protein